MKTHYDNIRWIKQLLTSLLVFGVFSVPTGCKKLVTVGSPPNDLTSENIYSNDATAAAVLTAIYAALNSNTPLRGTNLNSLSLVAGLSADELTLYGGSANANSTLVQYYLNNLISGPPLYSPSSIWGECYSYLYILNIALERIAVSNTLTPAVKRQVTGEAKFMRAFVYFYLVNLYGDVPLTTSSDYAVNSTLSRSSQAAVYQQIVTDLKDAKSLLSNSYLASDALSPAAERVRPTKWAASALLARTYLYTGNWTGAVSEADSVINQTSLFSLDSINNVFLANSKEAIWQLQPVNIGWNTEDARVFILPSGGPTDNSAVGFPVYLTAQLTGSFEPGDLRRHHWIDSVTVNGVTYYYPFKYKSDSLNAPVTEYLMVLRLGEQYLIRAEAEAELGENSAIKDLNTIRQRAWLSPYSGPTDQTSLLAAILHERQVELFTEWGHRWLDLKRTNQLNTVMDAVAQIKKITWEPYWQWYPIPSFDIAQDPNLVQNKGY